MATLYGTAGGDDVSYSRTLNKLLKVDVEKPPTTGAETPKPKLGAAHGRTSSRRGLELSTATPGAVPTAGLQVHWWEPQVSGSPTQHSNWQQSPPRGSTPGSSNSLRPRTSPHSPLHHHRNSPLHHHHGHPHSHSHSHSFYPGYQEDAPQGPDPPASFMRTPWTARSRRPNSNPHRNSSEASPPSSPTSRGADSGGGSSSVPVSSAPHLPARFYSSVAALGRGATHPQLRYLNQHLIAHQQAIAQQQQLASQQQQQQYVVHQLFPHTGLPMTPLSEAYTGVTSVTTPSIAATAPPAVGEGPTTLTSRGRAGGISNLSYKPSTNLVAEPAAAVVQRRERTQAAVGTARPDSSGSGGGSPKAAATAAAAASAGGAPRSPKRRGGANGGATSPVLGESDGRNGVRDAFARGSEGSGGEGDGGGGSSCIGGYAFGAMTEETMDGGGWRWQLNNLRGSWPTADGDAGGGAPYDGGTRPMTAPDDDGGRHRGHSGRRRGEDGRPLPSSPSPFAPPQQLYMRAQEEEAAAAAAARDVADLYDTAADLAPPRLGSLPRLSFPSMRSTSPPMGSDGAAAGVEPGADPVAAAAARKAGDSSAAAAAGREGDAGGEGGRLSARGQRAGSGAVAPKGARNTRTSGGEFAEAGEPGAAGVAGSATGDEGTAAAAHRASRGGSPSAADLQTSSSGAVAVAGDSSRTLQVGISVAALAEIVKVLGPSQQQASTAEVVKHWLLPPTQNTKCRFLDLILWRPRVLLGDPNELAGRNHPVLRPERSWTGNPDYYVIHAWSGNFAAMVAALQELCASLNKSPTTVRVWLDAVAVNHHPGCRDKKELAVCRHMLASGRRALLIIDAAAECLTRLWCLYEVWLVACVVPGANPGKLHLINAGADWRTVADAFLRIDLSRSGVTLPEDRSKLLEDFLRATRASAAAKGIGGGGPGSPPNGGGGGPIIGGGPGSPNPGAASALTLYLVGAALPKLSAAVRGALVDASGSALAAARRSARGVTGLLTLLDAAERYAMIRCIGGGHVEAEEQLTEVVAAVFEATGTKPYAGPSPLSQAQLTLPGHRAHGGAGGGASAGGAGGLHDGPDGIVLNLAANGDWSGDFTDGLDPFGASTGDLSGDGDGEGGGGGGIGSTASRGSRASRASASSEASGPYIDYGNDAVAAAMAAVLAPAGKMPHMKIASGGAGGGAGGGANVKSAAAAAAAAANVANLWKRRPATLAALAVLQVEHGRRVLAMTHASKALSFVPGLTLVRPNKDANKDKDGNNEGWEQGGAEVANGRGGGTISGAPGNANRSVTTNATGHVGGTNQPHLPRQSMSSGLAAGGSSGGANPAAAVDGTGGGVSGGHGHGHARPGAAGTTATAPGSPTQPRGGLAVAAGQVAWKGAYWELSNPELASAVAVRTIVMVSIVESACGRHEAAAQLALQAGLARAATLGFSHPATLAIRRAAVVHLIAADRVTDANLLASALLREALALYGEDHPTVGLCQGAMAQVLSAQNRPQQAFVMAQRGAEGLAAALGRTHPATLDALQICVDVLDSVQEYGKALALMRLVVEGRGAPGATRASPASPAFLAPTNRLLHLRTAAALEDKAAAENNSSLGRRNLLGIMRGLAKLETELKAALMAVGGRSLLIQKDLEQVLLAQNKRYEAALLQKGELPLTRMAGEATGGGGASNAAAGGSAGGGGGRPGSGGPGSAGQGSGAGGKPSLPSGGGGPLRPSR